MYIHESYHKGYFKSVRHFVIQITAMLIGTQGFPLAVIPL